MNNIIVVEKYKEIAKEFISMTYPNLLKSEIDKAVNSIVDKSIQDNNCQIYNNYTNKRRDMLLSEFTNFIMERQPICCSSGVMFMKHGTVPNPLSKMIQMFMDNRGIHKSLMLDYPKGSEEYEKYNLLQLLDKIDCNAIYGTLAAPTAMFYNIHVAASITNMGQSFISAATMFFEMFLSNNVKFSSLEEILFFIHNVKHEKRKFDDKNFIDRNIDVFECFQKLVYNIGDFRIGENMWLPDEEELNILYDIVYKLDQTTINRIYYKNNLYEFMNNKSMTRSLIYILQKLDKPYLNPNELPESISVELEALTDILKEYVYYKYQIMDKVDRCNTMIKKSAAISDTDSAIVSLDGWYHFAVEKTQGIDMAIKKINTDINTDTGEPEFKEELYEDYDFINDEIIYTKKMINPVEISAPEGLRYSIINIMAYIATILANDYILEYTKTQFSYSPDKKCLMYLKNEFLFKRVLLTDVKKNYASIQELQEGRIVNKEKELDIKGLQIKKSTLNKSTQQALEKILYEDILKSPEIDQLRVIKDIAILEKKIFQSLKSGNKEFYKPLVIKSLNSYEDPMGIQGIKASVIWNMIRDDGLEAIDLDSRNKIDIVKVNITERNIDAIKDSFPSTYEKIKECLSSTTVFRPIKKNGTIVGYDNDITSLAIPLDVKIPEWVKEFIDYKTIINDNLKVFPLESINVRTLNCDSVNYSNIMKL